MSGMAKKLDKLKELRLLMKNSSVLGTHSIDAYIIPSSDNHQSEYLSACDKRRDFMCGFTGSAGTAVVTQSHACMWTDGRYFLQAEEEMSKDWTLMKEGVPTTPTVGAWLAQNLNCKSQVGFDPNVMAASGYNALKLVFDPAGINLVPIEVNLVDQIWGAEKPARKLNPVVPLEKKYTGLTAKLKIGKVRESMGTKGCCFLVLSALDDVAWLLNLRGSDIPFNPVFFAYIVVGREEIVLCVDEKQVEASTSQVLQQHFQMENVPEVQIKPYHSIREVIKDRVKQLTPGGSERIWIPESSSQALCSLVPAQQLVNEVSPVAITKCIKNDAEIQGMINSHIRDAAALCCYFAWLEKEIAAGNEVTEISGATKLEEFRRGQKDYVGLSFETMSAVGPNAASAHYSPKPSTDRPITNKEVYVCDSGGQYKDGTTDVTRTIHLGTPSLHEKECYTRVFKGQYALKSSVFPSKIKGNCLDAFARKPLWDAGLDYLHGTGHGIGSYLNVHEGPIGISWRTLRDDPGLQEQMFLSNEPGYYEDGKFGIRIENIVRVIPAINVPFNFKNRGFLTFEDVTLVPIQTSMLVLKMLTEQEISYLNDYHAKCRKKISGLLVEQDQKDGLKWLHQQTEPIAH